MLMMRLEESISGFFVEPETLQKDDLETVGSIIRYVACQLASGIGNAA